MTAWYYLKLIVLFFPRNSLCNDCMYLSEIASNCSGLNNHARVVHNLLSLTYSVLKMAPNLLRVLKNRSLVR
jgi:hypothetical protein